MSPPGDEADWNITQQNIMYIRISGDVVYFEDHTIPTIVKTKLDNPGTLMVSANVINEAVLAPLHSHPGVALPYLPELYHTAQPSRSKSQFARDWRASSLPRWDGPADFRVQKGFSPPFEGHRWLLPTQALPDRDPIAASVYTENGPTLQDWTVSAQQHYSFLDHLESNTLDPYKFPKWVNPTEPISQNFGCFWGNDVEALREIFKQGSTDGVASASWIRPDGTRPQVTIDGKGLASHYSAHLATSGLDSTDLMNRYRAYAEENVCRQAS